jgi:hypothetical protein
MTRCGERLVDATKRSSRTCGHRLQQVANRKLGKKLRTKKNSLETEVSKLSF